MVGRFIFLVGLIFFYGCAQMVPPSGGPKDTIPPQMVSDATIPKNQTTNFNSASIQITFDEYIKLQNPNEQIIISPALENKPDFSVKGKKVMVKLNNTLKPNTTYTINFGNAIIDITENNPASGFIYVFSTGDFLDSLNISGQLVNSYSNTPEKGVWVLLHKNNSDTALQKIMPDYLSKTDANGNYNFNYLSGGNYQIHALRDLNSDYKYNQPTEEIAFHDEEIALEKNISNLNLRLFKEDNEKQYVKSSKFIWPGKLQIIMNKPYYGFAAKLLPYDTLTKGRITSLWRSATGDTLEAWFPRKLTEKDEEIKLSLRLEHDSLEKKIDTITFFVRDQTKQIPKLKMNSNASKQFDLYSSLYIRYDRPGLLVYESDVVLLKNDSIPIQPEIEKTGYGFYIKNKWEEKTDYKVILKADAYHETNYGEKSKLDTIRFTTVKKEFYGNIILTASVPGENFYLIITGKNKKPVYENYVVSGEKIQIPHLLPGSYKLQMIKDDNKNKVWDTGNLMNKTQPEKMYYYKDVVTIRSNWDFEVEWKVVE